MTLAFCSDVRLGRSPQCIGARYLGVCRYTPETNLTLAKPLGLPVATTLICPE